MFEEQLIEENRIHYHCNEPVYMVFDLKQMGFIPLMLRWLRLKGKPWESTATIYWNLKDLNDIEELFKNFGKDFSNLSKKDKEELNDRLMTTDPFLERNKFALSLIKEVKDGLVPHKLTGWFESKICYRYQFGNLDVLWHFIDRISSHIGCGYEFRNRPWFNIKHYKYLRSQFNSMQQMPAMIDVYFSKEHDRFCE